MPTPEHNSDRSEEHSDVPQVLISQPGISQEQARVLTDRFFTERYGESVEVSQSGEFPILMSQPGMTQVEARAAINEFLSQFENSGT